MCVCVCVCVFYQECIGAVSTDDPDADGLMLRFRAVPPNVNWSQVDDAFTDQKKKNSALENKWKVAEVKLTWSKFRSQLTTVTKCQRSRTWTFVNPDFSFHFFFLIHSISTQFSLSPALGIEPHNVERMIHHAAFKNRHPQLTRGSYLVERDESTWF